ncbi:cytochrome P450 [Paraliomyxa miuraensis]|uniref:cytochrome P450 n=1 Tax=Paraliomyxa miuraensis TaxID=376150 RepID=UPI00225A80F8|nr:cytochrome P450 [Paraliomyxa miuraensis]MCX4240769.1 cytochrome P450 [Paraliomyxa miuraensis]
MQTHTYPLDLLSPDFVHDPVPMIDRMHAEAPVFFDPRVNGWMVGSYRVTKALERDPRISAKRSAYVSALTPPPLQERAAPLVAWYAEWMVMRDGTDHRRLRRLAAHAFAPASLRSLEARMVAVVEPILDAAIARGEMELLSELAFPLPRTIICEMLGIPDEDAGLFTQWAPNINNLLSASLGTEEIIDAVAAARAQIQEYFVAAIEERRKAPREGEILSGLVQAIEGDDTLTVDEIIDLAVFIMIGAYDTTTYLISNGLQLLLRDPEQVARARGDASSSGGPSGGHIDGWIDETLRCDPPITVNTRVVAEGFSHEGHRFEPGQMVYFVSAAINRDPEHFPDPNRFDIERDNAGDHVSFGFGPHYCIGGPLARIEARVAFRTLLARTRELRLPEQTLERAPTMLLRGWKSLRLELT